MCGWQAFYWLCYSLLNRVVPRHTKHFMGNKKRHITIPLCVHWIVIILSINRMHNYTFWTHAIHTLSPSCRADCVNCFVLRSPHKYFSRCTASVCYSTERISEQGPKYLTAEFWELFLGRETAESMEQITAQVSIEVLGVYLGGSDILFCGVALGQYVSAPGHQTSCYR